MMLFRGMRTSSGKAAGKDGVRDDCEIAVSAATYAIDKPYSLSLIHI